MIAHISAVQHITILFQITLHDHDVSYLVKMFKHKIIVNGSVALCVAIIIDLCQGQFCEKCLTLGAGGGIRQQLRCIVAARYPHSLLCCVIHDQDSESLPPQV